MNISANSAKKAIALNTSPTNSTEPATPASAAPTDSASAPVIVYVFATQVLDCTAEWFTLKDLQGKFHANHWLGEGDRVKITIERIEEDPADAHR